MTRTKKPRIGLLVGNPFRDLPSQVLTALRLCQEGGATLLIPSYRRNYEIWTLAPDFVLLENLRRDKKGLLKRLAAAGIRAGVLDTEGGVFPDLDAYLGQVLPRHPVLDTVAGFYSWGPEVARRLVSAGYLREPQVAVTGTPRMDFYSDPWKAAARRFGRPSVRPGGRFVLINGNFNIANPWLRDLQQTVLEYVKDGRPREQVLDWIDIQRRAMTELTDLSRRLAARLPDVTFVYRPHPFEKPEPYVERLQGFDNLRLAKEGAVYGWLLGASAVIHRGSSTAIEAALAGVPAFSPAWIPAHLNLPSVEAVSVFCHSEDDLVERIRAAVAQPAAVSKAVREKLDRIVSAWFLAVDGRSHERLAAAILRSSNGGSVVSHRQCLRILEGRYGSRVPWRHRVRSAARRGLGLPFHWSFRHWRDEPDLSFDRSQCFFGVEQVRCIAAALEPAAREYYGNGWRPVQVRPAGEAGEYHFDYRHGRSIVLTAA